MEGEKGNHLPQDKTAADIISEHIRKYHDALETLAQKIGYSKEDAEDLVQDTYAVVVQKSDQFIASTNRESWVFGILRRCMGHLKRDAQYGIRLEEQLRQYSSGVHEDQLDLLMLYRGIVSDEDLELLVLHCVKKVSYEKLAQMYGRSEPALRKRVQRARDKCRQVLGED